MNRFRRLPVTEILDSDPALWKRRAARIGLSRQGRTLRGSRLGTGSSNISLIGGCHADEPVGPAMLELLASYLLSVPEEHELLCNYTWHIVPHVNPDGEFRNRLWTGKRVAVRDYLGRPDDGYDLAYFLAHVVRELPGDDIEFGFPRPGESASSDIRPENIHVAEFLAKAAPLHLHGSFHGMALAPGPWFLLEAEWIERTVALRSRLTSLASKMKYGLFDAQRHGEKGFHRIAPGFTTRPDSVAMREFFEARGQSDEAAKFRPSSMEFARANGSDPMTFVSEMPLFLTPSLGGDSVERHQLQEIRLRLEAALAQDVSSLARTATELKITAMPIRDQMRLQLALLNNALAAVFASGPNNPDRR
jgi:hypothetical protein